VTKRGVIKRFDTYHTDEVTCPYCGYEHDCSHEYFDVGQESIDIGCEGCGKEFFAKAESNARYTTRKIGEA